MELTDGVVRLRRFGADDVAALARACDDAETARFAPGVPSPYSEDDARRYLEYCERAWAFEPGPGPGSEGARRPLAVVDAATGELLGAVDVRLGEHGSIGYWTAPWARGRGVATRGLRLLAAWALAEGGVRTLELLTHPENAASQRVAEKAGFRRIGAVRDRVRFRDGTTAAILFERS